MTSNRLDLDDAAAKAELDCRARNLLATLRAIVRRSSVDAEDVESYAARLDGRIAALSRVHAAAIYQPHYKVGLEEIILDELLAHATAVGNVVSVSADGIFLNARMSGAFALAIHELVVNSITSGVLSRSNGTIVITATIVQSGVSLTWLEKLGEIEEMSEPFDSFSIDYLTNGVKFDINGTTNLRLSDVSIEYSVIATEK